MMLYIFLYIKQENNTVDINNVDNDLQTEKKDIISLHMG